MDQTNAPWFSRTATVSGTATFNTDLLQWTVEQTGNKKGINPSLYFKYIKKKFGILETIKLDARLKRLEKAFNQAVENGQESLGAKLLTELTRESRESIMYAKGIRHFIAYSDVTKYKKQIHGGHISDTYFKEFTRVIPKDVLEKKAKVQQCFDDFIIYHVWDEEAEKKRTKDQKMSEKEAAKMRDPVLFGVIKESNRLYFIADWEDEHCDLTFEEMIDVIGGDDERNSISRTPKL